MSIKLRELIKNVRSCKTAQEERGVIAKECALMRTSFKEEDSSRRSRNVAKLLFIHMLGYPSHFGKMECIKLIASPRFPDKRIGYLGLCLLVEENSEVLTLVTNSLSSDLGHHNPYVVGLALAALGNISNADMLRDLSTTVHKMLGNTNPFIRKKAALCAARIFKRVPDVVEDFVDRVTTMIGDRNHSVLLTTTTLMIDISKDYPAFRKKIRKSIPALVKTLRNLAVGGLSPEHSVSGIADPFLQVKLLRLLRILGKDHDSASEQMNDVLTHIATNTDSSKNAGNAILYECVQTIMTIRAEESLRVLAINILGRFLQNRDNNIRYVALHTLGAVVEKDKQAVQRHRQTIVDCLKGPDESIRARALDLVYKLMSEDTVAPLTKELLNYLAVAPSALKRELCANMERVIDQFAPSRRWHIDTLISMLSIAGNEAPERVWQMLITLVGQASAVELRPYVAHKMFAALKEDLSQLGLVHVGIWVIGEYGQLLRDPPPPDSGGEGPVSEAAIVDLLERITVQHNVTWATRAMVLNACVKLVARLQDEAALSRLAAMAAAHRTSTVLELQARSCEFANMVQPDLAAHRGAWLASMPVPTEEQVRNRRIRFSEERGSGSDSDSVGGAAPPPATEASGDLINLEEIFGSTSAPVAQPAPKTADVDLLADVFGAAPVPAPPAATGQNDLLDLMGGGGSSSLAGSGNLVDLIGTAGSVDLMGAGIASTSGTAGAVPGATAAPSQGSDTMDLLAAFGGESEPATNETITAFQEDGLVITMALTKEANGEVSIQTVFSNTTEKPMESFVFQAAVPKYVTLQMGRPTGSLLPANSSGAVTQTLRVTNSMMGQKPLMVKIKLMYKTGGQAVDKMASVTNFPQGM